MLSFISAKNKNEFANERMRHFNFDKNIFGAAQCSVQHAQYH